MDQHPGLERGENVEEGVAEIAPYLYNMRRVYEGYVVFDEALKSLGRDIFDGQPRDRIKDYRVAIAAYSTRA